MSYPLSLVEFKSWLEAKNENEVVGWQGGCRCCPIFKCLKYRNNDVISVNGTTTYVNGSLLKNPKWVNSFISEVDNCSVIPLKQGEMNASITAQQALKVLNNLYICTVCNQYNPEGKNCGKDNCDW